MKEEFILKVLGKTLDILTQEQVQQLRSILEDELYNLEIQAAVTALVPINDMNEKLFLFLTAKRLDGLSPNTLKDYKRQILKFSFVIQKNIENITTMDIRMYLAMRVKSGIKDATLASDISTLKSFFGWLQCNDYILKNPMLQIKTPKTDKYVRKALNPEEFEMLRDACEDSRGKSLVEFFYSTGCRLSELVSINKQDIDWQNERLKVIGKGDVERYVFLSERSLIHLKRYLESRKDTCEALFVCGKGQHDRLGGRGIEDAIKKIEGRCGFAKGFSPHSFRRSLLSNLASRECPITVIKELAGHSDINTTNRYITITPEFKQQSFKKYQYQ